MTNVFLSHGGPGLVLQSKDQPIHYYWKSLGNELNKVNAVITVSAHWPNHRFTSDKVIHVNTKNKIIYDLASFSKVSTILAIHLLSLVKSKQPW